MKLSDIINYNNIKSDSYKIFGIIHRKYSARGVSQVIFNPQNVIDLKNDYDLQRDDIIQIFSENEITNFQKSYTKYINDLKNFNENPNSNSNKKNGSENLSSVNKQINNDEILDYLNKESTLSNNFENLSLTNSDNISDDNDSKNKIGNNNIQLARVKEPNFIGQKYFEFFQSYNVEVEGSVVLPGYFPLGGDIALSKILSLAGGPTVSANMDNIEIYNPKGDYVKTTIIRPGYRIVVPNLKIENENISLVGSVIEKKSFGKGKIKKLSQLLKKEKNNISKDAYMYFGYIKRKEYLNNTVKYYPFSPWRFYKMNKKLF